MGQYGLLGSIIGGIVGDGPGWFAGQMIGNEIDRRNDEEEITERYKRHRENDDNSERGERIMTINETQMSQLIKQALDEQKTRGPFVNATFEQVENGDGYVVSLNFTKQDKP